VTKSCEWFVSYQRLFKGACWYGPSTWYWSKQKATCVVFTDYKKSVIALWCLPVSCSSTLFHFVVCVYAWLQVGLLCRVGIPAGLLSFGSRLTCTLVEYKCTVSGAASGECGKWSSARNLSLTIKMGARDLEMRTEYQCIVGVPVSRPHRGLGRLSLSVTRQTERSTIAVTRVWYTAIYGRQRIITKTSAVLNVLASSPCHGWCVLC
jgi:hypothetical protein